MSARRAAFERGGLALAGAVMLFLLVGPVAALLLKTSPQVLVAGLQHPLVWPALKLSVVSTLASLSIVLLLGTPMAWMLSRTNATWARWVETLILMPMVIPPAVSGLTLLLAFGRHGLFTEGLGGVWTSLAFTPFAVVLAQVFVSGPFYVQAAISAFRRIDENLLLVARTLGAHPLRLLFRIAIPIAGSGLASAAAVSWARALGEFGATLMFAGNLEGVTQTLPLAIYTAAESDMRAAQALSLVLVVVAFGVLFVIRRASTEPSDARSRAALGDKHDG